MTPDAVELRAGPVTLLFEPATGWARYLSVGGVEVVRAIYGAVRDRHWGTVSPAVEGLEVDAGADRFRVRFRAVCRQGPIDFRWDAEVSGEPDGAISYQFRGVAHGAFLRNRIGLCVLHPLWGLSGVPGFACRVTHPDGRETTAPFPRLVAPHQPFRDVRAMRYRAVGSPEVELTFAGEVFETEDQRNWTDGSFKTYGTPLAVPFPVAVRPGDAVEQTVTVRVLPQAELGTRTRPAVLALLPLPSGPRPLPRIGTAAPPDVAHAPDPYFAELNRNRPPADFTGAVRYSVNPQVHATDGRSIVEGLEGVADTVTTARSFLPPGANLVVGPITLAPRFAPDGDGWAVAPRDPRGRMPFGTAWLVGCLTELTRAGAGACEFGDGWGGPAAEAVAWFADRAGRPAHVLDSAHPLTAAGLLCDGVAWVASRSARPQRVCLPDGTEFDLGPYELVRHPLAGGGR